MGVEPLICCGVVDIDYAVFGRVGVAWGLGVGVWVRVGVGVGFLSGAVFLAVGFDAGLVVGFRVGVGVGAVVRVGVWVAVLVVVRLGV